MFKVKIFLNVVYNEYCVPKITNIILVFNLFNKCLNNQAVVVAIVKVLYPSEFTTLLERCDSTLWVNINPHQSTDAVRDKMDFGKLGRQHVRIITEMTSLMIG